MRQFLIVDTDIQTIDTIKTEEYFSNFTIFFALHGGEALDILENHAIDCIVIDMNVDHVNGLEIIDLLQRNVRRPWIIATCDHSNSLTNYPWLELALSIGADEVLAKPYCREQLLDRLPASIFDIQKKDTKNLTRHEQEGRHLLQQSVTH